MGVPVGIAPPRLVRKNFEDIFIRFGATHERDRHTDTHTGRRTHRHAMHMHKRGKNDGTIH